MTTERKSLPNFITWEAKDPILDVPYFGTQKRYSDYFAELIKNYIPNLEGVSYAETNSGNVGTSYLFAKKYGMKVHTNDLGLFSYYVASSLGDKDLTDSERKERREGAAYCCALIEVMEDYSPRLPETEEEIEKVEIAKQKWIKTFEELTVPGLYASTNNLDLEDLLETMPAVDVLYSDYAWPWREAEEEVEGETKEYTASVDLFRKYLIDETLGFTALTRHEIVDFCLRNAKKGLKKCKYYLLNNQSSNYPTPEILEMALMDAGYEFDRYVMRIEKIHADDLGHQDDYMTDKWFVETTYVIKGDLHPDNIAKGFKPSEL